MNKINKILIFLLMIGGCLGISWKDKNPASENLDRNKWISNCSPVLTDDASMYGIHPAPLFRREFVVEAGKIRKATLSITAAGYYKANLNGERIGDIYLDPAWTTFSKRIYFTKYDLTSSLKKGVNCLGVTLGNGFYNLLPLRLWGDKNLRNALPTGIPTFTARLVVEYENGKTTEISTDDSWKFTSGPVLKNNVYIGEWYDARKELSGWDKPGYNDLAWENACILNSPTAKLQACFFPPVKISDRFSPVKISSPATGVYLADMGTNFAGIYKIRMKGNVGDTITLRFGERIYDNGSLNPMTTACGQIKGKGVGGPGAPDVAWQTDTYVFGKTGEVWYSPDFTFHAFRYLEIKGLNYEPKPADIQGMALNSAVEECNHFECSSDLLNSIQKIATRTFKANLVSVQSDCPGRERFGYGGDINAVSESFICNFNMHGFYRKTIYDWVDAMNDSIFIDTAPYVGIKFCGISWESAFLMLQNDLLVYYGDTDIVREMYSLDLKWMQKVARFHPEFMVEQGLGDHESLTPVPVRVTGTGHYLKAAGIMKRFAALMGDGANEKKFIQLESTLREKMQKELWNVSDGRNEKLNKQTLFSSLLYAGVIPENEKSAAVDSLLVSIKKGVNNHFTTGIFGTKYILEALSQSGLTQQVFDVVNSREYPGWGFMIDRGATTLWETWKESDNTYSNCHPMFGSVSEWFYRWLGGIRPDMNHPGFRKFYLEPQTPEGLTYVKTSYQTPFGYIRSNWEKTSSGETKYTISVPKGTIAMLRIAAKDKSVEVRCDSKRVNLGTADYSNGYLMKELAAGEYVITRK